MNRLLLGGIVTVLAVMLSACGTIRIEAGAPFDTAKLEAAPRPGISTQHDVREALGELYGKGGAFLPFHDAPRTAWIYFHERGGIDMGKGEMNDDHVYLFVFFAGDTFDSYMWFTSALAPLKK